MDKAAFLARVRQGLGRTEGAPAPGYPPLGESPAEVAARVERRRAERAARRPELVERLTVMAVKAGWKVARCATPAEAEAYLKALAAGKGLKRAAHTLHPAVKRLSLDAALPGVERTAIALEGGATRAALRQNAAEAELGITGVDFAIAETGTCVLVSGRGASRFVSLMPPAHVAIVQPEQVVDGLDDVFLERRLAYLQGERRSYMSFITGPSRTGDIEMTIVVGAHGPGEVHMLIMG